MRRPDPERRKAILDWKAAFGSPLPRYLSGVFMRKALTYHMQYKSSGGLPASTRRALMQIAAGKSVNALNLGGVSSGAHLVREGLATIWRRFLHSMCW
ncbi:MAG: hypothetical protein ACR2O8_00835 [Rhizobiaceae bacterium]